ncbi:MAG: hypothetical protein NTW87_19815 [Planctomycetota bacterium]|nr:hypothetical protein [Planctomycetota bacterium]
MAEVARQQSLPAAKLVEGILTRFLESLPDDPAAWVQVTRNRLPKVWQSEDFSDWVPPRGGLNRAKYGGRIGLPG